ncbi:MAG: galactokinase [Actinomycetes bacterium]
MSAATPYDEVCRAFTDTYGTRPEGAWAAPGRVNLIGEHTDYNEGFVLPFAIEARTVVAGARRDGTTVRVASRQRPGEDVSTDDADLRPGRPGGWSSYVLGVIWALRDDGHHIGGVDLLVDGGVALGSGLSSSAALECAAALALCDLHGLGLPAERLAGLAQRAENDYVGAPTGPMDQMASLLCTAGHALLLDTRSMATEQVPLDPAGAGLELVVVDTGVHHEHAEGAYGERRRSCERACAALAVRALRDVPVDGLEGSLERLGDDELRRRVRHVVTEDARTIGTVDALRSGDWAGVGRLMSASHVSMRDDYEISCAELDVAVAALVDAGALGARMTGGGFGGCAVALLAATGVDAAVRAVHEEFAVRGWAAPFSFVTRPGGGASRVL